MPFPPSFPPYPFDAATQDLKLEEALVPWQGHHDNKIDRFDVRAMMDIIPEFKGPGK